VVLDAVPCRPYIRTCQLNVAEVGVADVAEIVEACGGLSALGHVLGISRQAVSHWEVVPEHWLDAVARLSGMSFHQLRPDLYDMRNIRRDPIMLAQAVARRRTAGGRMSR
jgi:hypothetical protein